MNRKTTTAYKDYRYHYQQDFLNELAKKHGFVCFRPNYHAQTGDANTVMLYTVEDEAHNRKVDKQPTTYSASEARDRRKNSGIVIPDECVYRDSFFDFFNTDVNGRFDYNFANHGKLDLRGLCWKNVLEGAILVAFAIKKRNEYIRSSGGLGEIREADNTYNDLNREAMTAFLLRHGMAFMGNINFHGDDHKAVANGQKSVYEEFIGQNVCNFQCDFIVPCADQELEELIREWNSDDSLPKDPKDVDKITKRVDALGGIHFIWY